MNVVYLLSKVLVPLKKIQMRCSPNFRYCGRFSLLDVLCFLNFPRCFLVIISQLLQGKVLHAGCYCCEMKRFFLCGNFSPLEISLFQFDLKKGFCVVGVGKIGSRTNRNLGREVEEKRGNQS